MLKDNTLNIRVGDKIQVHTTLKEGDKERSHSYTGTVIKIKGSGASRTFTVRRIGATDVGIEKTWPVKCPNITSVKVLKSGKVRRAKLYYLRNRHGNTARLKNLIHQTG